MLFGDFLTVDRGLLIEFEDPSTISEKSISVSDYLSQLNQQLYHIISASNEYLNKRWNIIDNKEGDKQFNQGDYVLVSYPTRRPSKLSAKYRGPMIVVERSRNKYKCIDVLSNVVSEYDVSRLFLFRDTSVLDLPIKDVARDLNLNDREEFEIEAIVDHLGSHKDKRNLQFRIRWLGYGPNEDTWMYYRKVKEFAALDDYLETHPELKL